jgi:hypothetical protein
MKSNGENESNNNSKKSKCIHHWMLGSSVEGICIGVCKKCGEKKEFLTRFKPNFWTGTK